MRRPAETDRLMTTDDESDYHAVDYGARHVLPSPTDAGSQSDGTLFNTQRSGARPPAAAPRLRAVSRRPKAKKRGLPARGPREETRLAPLSAYMVSESIDIDALQAFVEQHPHILEEADSGHEEGDLWQITRYSDVLHACRLCPHEDDPILQQRDLFIFDFGAIVAWAFPTLEDEKATIGRLDQFWGSNPEDDFDDMEFSYGSHSYVGNDLITLQGTDPIEKLSISFAMAQSGKLSVFEERVDQTIQETEHIPRELAATGAVHMTQKQISMMIGQLYIERANVNLHTDMLDTPEFFWDNDEWEELYGKVTSYFDLRKRVEVLNRRLDILGDLWSILKAQQENQHGTALEWIVIWLIVVEVVLELVWNIIVKDLLKWVSDC